jgi:hypothetical protein
MIEKDNEALHTQVAELRHELEDSKESLDFLRASWESMHSGELSMDQAQRLEAAHAAEKGRLVDQVSRLMKELHNVRHTAVPERGTISSHRMLQAPSTRSSRNAACQAPSSISRDSWIQCGAPVLERSTKASQAGWRPDEGEFGATMSFFDHLKLCHLVRDSSTSNVPTIRSVKTQTSCAQEVVDSAVTSFSQWPSPRLHQSTQTEVLLPAALVQQIRETRAPVRRLPSSVAVQVTPQLAPAQALTCSTSTQMESRVSSRSAATQFGAPRRIVVSRNAATQRYVKVKDKGCATDPAVDALHQPVENYRAQAEILNIAHRLDGVLWDRKKTRVIDRLPKIILEKHDAIEEITSREPRSVDACVMASEPEPASANSSVDIDHFLPDIKYELQCAAEMLRRVAVEVALEARESSSAPQTQSSRGHEPAEEPRVRCPEPTKLLHEASTQTKILYLCDEPGHSQLEVELSRQQALWKRAQGAFKASLLCMRDENEALRHALRSLSHRVERK